jgi:hypothetical protein
MHLADLVRSPGVVEDAFSRGGLTRIDVRGNPNVPHPFERYRAGHKFPVAPGPLFFFLFTYQR